MRIIENTKPRKVKVGDEIIGYGTVTDIRTEARRDHHGKLSRGPFFTTDLGCTLLSFPTDHDVPVVSKRFWIHYDAVRVESP